MALPDEEWLPQAMRLPVGRSARIYHKREGRPNLVIKNLVDKYTAYCHACREGAVKQKEHVRLTGVPAPKDSSSLSVPTDLVAFQNLTELHKQRLLELLASKGMDFMYLPELWYSDSRKRLLIRTDQGWMGRDVTGNSLQKWITYNNQKFLAKPASIRNVAVIVEDTFSFYKVCWAMRHCPNVGVYCALGTELNRELLLRLIQYEQVLFFFDGDKAGWSGSTDAAQRVRAFGVPSRSHCATLACDPKDMQINDIKEHIWSGTKGTQSMT